MIPEVKPAKEKKFELVKVFDEKDKSEKVEYFDQDIAWLWCLREVKEEKQESKR